VDVSDVRGTPRIKVAASLPPVDVQRLFEVMPGELVPALRGLRMRGTLGWELAVDLDSGNPSALKDKGLDSRPNLTGFAVDSLGDVIDFNALRDQHAYVVRAADGSETTRLVGPNASGWVPWGGISPYVAKALNTTEDGTFWSNDGVAPFAMRESLVANLERGAFVRGGSTITQQLVKNLYLGGQKLIGRKLQELFIAWRMTNALTKQEIMELYLNTIEFAPGVYGVGSAAFHWFGKRAADLTLPEAVFLASIVPAPRRYHSFWAAGGISPKWRDYVASLIEIMVRRGHVTREEVDALGAWELAFRASNRAGRTSEAVYDQLPEPDGGEAWDGDLLNQPR
jgi:membrane peptidoglycan carboxypeptidase